MKTPKLLSNSDLAARWNVSRQVVHNWSFRRDDFPIVAIRVDNGRMPLYLLKDVLKYEKERGINMLVNLSRDEAIERASEFLEEDVTEGFNQEEERNEIDGSPHFYVSNSQNATVKIETYLSDDEVDVLYKVTTENIFE